MKFLTPTILILLAIGIFFGYTNGVYTNIKALSATKAQLAQAESSAAALRAKREILAKQYNDIPDTNIARLEKAIPDGVDNIKLVLDINDIASKYGITIKGIQINQQTAGTQASIVGPDNRAYGSITLAFSLTTSYETFLSFLRDLETNLRFVDVTSLTFASNKDNLYNFGITIKTYWLK